MTKWNVSASHVDTCHPDYLQDSHSRPGEWLLCVSTAGQTDEAAVEDLMDQMNGEAPPEDWPNEITDEQIEAALRDAVRPVDLRPVDDRGNKLDAPRDGDDEGGVAQEEYEAAQAEEQPYAYFVIQWSRDDGDGDEEEFSPT